MAALEKVPITAVSPERLRPILGDEYAVAGEAIHRAQEVLAGRVVWHINSTAKGGGVAEMLHDLCHRTESTMARVYGGWKSEELTTNWARFAANFAQSHGVAACGTCHWPPNAERDYDYANPRFVDSSAEDWLRYPHLTGKTSKVNRETWGGPDYHRNYMRWWFSHLPKAAGVNADGRLNNWWEYVFNFEKFTCLSAVTVTRYFVV